MPWDIIAIPVIICLIWGFRQGLKVKNRKYRYYYFRNNKKDGFINATQDAGIEIRRGSMTRDQALNLVKMYDNSYPHDLIDVYLDYYKMTKKEFDEVLDNYANKDLFEKKDGRWVPLFNIN